MKLKLALARILLINPKILFLDEPMLGLDPKSVIEVIDILKNLNKTIFLTSHQMSVVEKLCDRIAFLNKGEILRVDTKENFKETIRKGVEIQVMIKNKKNQLIEQLRPLNYINSIHDENDWIFINLINESSLSEIFGILKDYTILKFKKIEPDLGQLFIKLLK